MKLFIYLCMKAALFGSPSSLSCFGDGDPDGNNCKCSKIQRKAEREYKRNKKREAKLKTQELLPKSSIRISTLSANRYAKKRVKKRKKGSNSKVDGCFTW